MFYIYKFYCTIYFTGSISESESEEEYKVGPILHKPIPGSPELVVAGASLVFFFGFFCCIFFIIGEEVLVFSLRIFLCWSLDFFPCRFSWSLIYRRLSSCWAPDTLRFWRCPLWFWWLPWALRTSGSFRLAWVIQWDLCSIQFSRWLPWALRTPGSFTLAWVIQWELCSIQFRRCFGTGTNGTCPEVGFQERIIYRVKVYRG